VAAPKLVAALHLTPGEQGWAASIAMVGLVFGAFVGGWIADRFGRKPVLLASVAAFGLFSLATAASTSYELLLLARFAAGLGFGGALPNLTATVNALASPERRNATTTAALCGLPMGGALSALIARLAGDGLDWRSIFVIGGVAPMLVLPLLAVLLPETRPKHGPDTDLNVAHALFGEQRAAGTLFLWAATVLTQMILFLALNWLPTLIIAKGLPPATGFAGSMAFNILGVIGAVIFGARSDRPGWRWPFVAAYLVMGAVLAGFAVFEDAVAILLLSGALGFFCNGGIFTLYAVAPTLYPPQLRAAGAGASIAVGRFGSIAGPLIAGQLRDAGATPNQVFLVMAPIAVMGAAVMFGLSVFARRDPG